MSIVPTHFQDKHKMLMLEKYNACTQETVDILCIIEKLASSGISDGHVKTTDFEISIKK
jgi:hypothetical protein